MKKKLILDYLKSLLEEKKPKEKKNKNKKKIKNYRYLDDGQIDSLEIFSFIQKIEKKFKLTLSPEDTNSDEFRYIEGLVKIIESKIC